MLYSMKFQTVNSILKDISDNSLIPLNIQQLKDRFNSSFIKNKECSAVVITFVDKGVNKSFIGGFRNQDDNSQKVYIIDMQTKKEYSPKEFSEELALLQTVLN